MFICYLGFEFISANTHQCLLEGGSGLNIVATRKMRSELHQQKGSRVRVETDPCGPPEEQTAKLHSLAELSAQQLEGHEKLHRDTTTRKSSA